MLRFPAKGRSTCMHYLMLVLTGLYEWQGDYSDLGGAHVHADCISAVGDHVGCEHGEVARSRPDVEEGVPDLGAEGLQGQGFHGRARHLDLGLRNPHALVLEAVRCLRTFRISVTASGLIDHTNEASW